MPIHRPPRRRRPSLAAAVIVALAATSTSFGQSTRATTQPTPPLEVGDLAPPLDPARWYRGEPVADLAPGHVYVVEFWSTWCAPCKASIPHLTELQRQYVGRATIVGVDVWERVPDKAETDAAIAAIVEPFVARMGDRMAYTVAGDGADQSVAAAWLGAAGVEGIPAAFIVGRDRRIEWIGVGYPSTLDDALAAVVAGTWDRDAERQRERDARAAATRWADLSRSLMAARKTSDAPAMASALSAMVAARPDYATSAAGIQFQMEADLLADPARAVAYARSLAAPGGAVDAKPELVIALLAPLPATPTPAVPADALAAIADALRPIVAREQVQGYAACQRFARLLDNVGQPAEAARYQSIAIGRLEESIAKLTPDVPADHRARMAKQLDGDRATLQTYLYRAKPN